MFPRLKQTISTALVDRIDDLVEFSTLGEYVLADDLMPIAAAPSARVCDGARDRLTPASPAPRSRDDCPIP